VPVILHLAVWTIAPPIWCGFELWARQETTDTKRRLGPGGVDFDQFKYSQELAMKIWAAVLVVLLYFFPDGIVYKLSHLNTAAVAPVVVTH
jgi:hypothetical protein